MKINQPIKISTTTSSVSKSSSKSGVKSPSKGASSGASAKGVSLSNSANFVQSMREASEQIPEIRSDIVEQAKADIESGNLGNEKDYEQAVTALLMEL